MFVGASNQSAKLEKLTITIQEGKDKGKKIPVLYNPEQYTQSREVNAKQSNVFGANGQEIQIPSAQSEIITFTLFFDTMSAGDEVGEVEGHDQFIENRSKASAEKALDVRTYTQKIYDLTIFDTDIHTLPSLKLEWSSLQFVGFLIKCSQHFTKFNEKGMPVRATMECTFREALNLKDEAKKDPNNSPDTSKFRTIAQGDSLWSLAIEAYGQPEQWRVIASANGLTNPRRLRSGERLALPALK